MKTTISTLISAIGLFLLWATPILRSEEFDAGWFVIDLGIWVGTYLMLVHPELFSFMARRNKQIMCSALA